MRHRLHEGWLLIILASALFLLVSLATYSADDPGWSSTGLQGVPVVNWGGRAGAFIADLLLSLFGVTAYLFPVLIVFSSRFDQEKAVELHARVWPYQLLGWFCFVIGFSALMGFYVTFFPHLPAHSGGMMGDIFGQILTKFLNRIGSTLFLITLLLFGITLLTGVSWMSFVDRLGKVVLTYGTALFLRIKNGCSTLLKLKFTSMPQKGRIEPRTQVVATRAEPMIAQPFAVSPPPAKLVVMPKEVARIKKPVILDTDIRLAEGALPPTTLLNATPLQVDQAFENTSFEALSLMVEQRLSDFGVQVKVVGVLPGPVITRFELDLAPGIKVSKITGLAKDIARSLSVVSVRVVEVIPGKSVIGLEIPNQNRELVTLRDMLESQRYAQSRSPVSLVLGKDISGNPIIVDLIKMPHLLVAGTTGSGKSVSLNAMLLSMLFKSTPQQLRLILIDPKMLELSIYDGIPHLLTPVITDMKDASNALRWCVAEMDKRYRLMASQGVRNLLGYNQKVNDAIKRGEPITMPGILVTDEASAKQILEPLPLIVVIADELADMMMLVGKKVEDLIARIAQKARAAGIHLILATQRPSVDVITGLIKANIPTRIAFQVSSRIDSRTILDQQGAEQLLGHGDMLYLPPGAGVPIRIHGAYVADDEVHRVVAAWRSVGEPVYLEGVTESEESAEGGEGESAEQDALYDEAVRIVLESRRASISLVQRRLRIGYNRAARMMEAMERSGVVSTVDQNGGREVLVGA